MANGPDLSTRTSAIDPASNRKESSCRNALRNRIDPVLSRSQHMPMPQPTGITAKRPYSSWKTIARWTVLACCVALFVHALTRTDLSAGWERIKAIGPVVVVVLLPFPIALVSDSFAWRRLLDALGPTARIRDIVRARLCTEAVSMSTPGGVIWAEALAPVLIARRTDLPIANVVASSTARRWLVIRMHGVYVTGATALGVDALSRASRQLVGTEALVVVAALSALGLVLLSLGIETLTTRGRLASRLSEALARTRLFSLQSWIETRRHHFSDADTAITALSDDDRATRTASAGLLGLWLIEGFETFLILRLLGADLGMATVMSFDAALSVVRSTAFFAPAGIGVQDLGYLTVLEAYGVPVSSGIAPAFIVLKRMKEVLWIAVGYAILAFARSAKPTSSLDSASAGAFGSDVNVNAERLGRHREDQR